MEHFFRVDFYCVSISSSVVSLTQLHFQLFLPLIEMAN